MNPYILLFVLVICLILTFPILIAKRAFRHFQATNVAHAKLYSVLIYFLSVGLLVVIAGYITLANISFER